MAQLATSNETSKTWSSSAKSHVIATANETGLTTLPLHPQSVQASHPQDSIALSHPPMTAP